MKTLKLQTKWVIHDRKKFSELIIEAKTLIDGLQEITKAFSTVARQEGMMRYNIQQVSDADTLQLVADVSQEDYPDISDVASVKVEILTIATNERLAIESWVDDVDSYELEAKELDVESMINKERLKFADAMTHKLTDSVLKSLADHDEHLTHHEEHLTQQEECIAQQEEYLTQQEECIAQHEEYIARQIEIMARAEVSEDFIGQLREMMEPIKSHMKKLTRA